MLSSAAPQSQHGSLVLSHFPQRAALDAGSELEELLQMWHLASSLPSQELVVSSWNVF